MSTLWLLLLLEAPARSTSDVPLQAPEQPKKEREEWRVGPRKNEEPGSAPAVGGEPSSLTSPGALPDSVLDSSFIVALNAFVDSGVAAPLALGFRLTGELGYRLPSGKRMLGVSIAPSFFAGVSSASLLGVVVGASTLGVSLPLLATLNVAVGPGLLRALAGPTFEWSSVRASRPGVERDDLSLGFGALLGVGYGLPAGPGLVLIDVRYSLRMERLDRIDRLRHGPMLGVGYAFAL